MQSQIIDQIGYDKIIEHSMRDVIFKVLKQVSDNGLKGDHYFIITFYSKFSGVELSSNLRQKFPREMTIVLQHQFNNLKISSDRFQVDLKFSGVKETIVIPYNSIISFADPSVNFGLKFSIMDHISEEFEEYDAEINKNDEGQEIANEGHNIDLSQKIISLDDFRKNNNK